MIEYREDDPTGAHAAPLVAAHLSAMHAGSPPESVHALDAAALRAPGIRFWTAWVDGELAGMGALKLFAGDRGELKSMRVADGFRGTGVGRGVLRHIVGEAQATGVTSLWLETGAGDEFLPARRLYDSEGFVLCPPFADYVDDPLSLFFTRTLRP